MAEKYLVRLGYELKEVEVEDGPDGLRVRINGQWHNARLEQVGQSALYALLIDGHPHELFAVERAEGYAIVIGWDVYAKAGVEVVEGDVLMVIEARKMNNELRAQRAGRVREVYVAEGQRVEAGMSLLVLE